MSILKQMAFDSYAYQVGTFPIASTDIGKVKAGMFCKLNAKKEICLAKAGEKAFMVLSPKEVNVGGLAITHGAFYVGAFTLNIDEECFDGSKTYNAQEVLYVDANGKLTNVKAGETSVPVAQVLRPIKTVNGKKYLAVASYNGVI